VITFIVVQQIFFGVPSFDKILMKTASELNKMCPIMVDQYTRWDNTAALPNNTFEYNYTLISHTKSEVNLDTAKKYVLPGLINRVKTEPDLKMFRDKNVTMIYNYHDKNGVFVVRYSITPDMYK
jgi:predicted secreted Zn-dependent protease